ncbi:haloacid dehalogenase [Tetragenococcus halophilus subsp. flandriensis]|uniref:HAD family hydrolase n=1 Tax=Tetragenococcus halophilus TaxID=51669 RepID=UPI0023E94054|nr:HAD family hydrolase [Tetragenococcus halophilus]GMA08825.1 haloacid dehalogenase [Tetragenococcus halophilus subsp. flandriensis]
MTVAIFFDVDDTLLDNYTAFKETLFTLSSIEPLPEEQMQELYKNFRLYSEHIYKQYHKTRFINNINARWQWVAKNLNMENDPSLLEDLDDLYHRNQQKQKLSKDFVDLFSFLTENEVYFGVLTNGLVKAQAKKIKQLNLSNYMPSKQIFISENLNDAKPNFSCFEKVEQTLPKNIDSWIYVGDSFTNDIEPLLNSHWLPIWLNRFNEQVTQDGYVEVKGEEEAVMTLRKLIHSEKF